MGLPNVREALRVPGSFCINPVQGSLPSAFPHGGTGLGLVRDVECHLQVGTDEITAEEFGGTVTEVIYCGERVYFAAFLRAMDNDAIAAIFPNTSVGSVPSGSGDRRIDYNPVSGIRPGKKLSDLAVPLLFSPLDLERHHFVYFPKAIPRVEETALLQLSFAEEVGIAVAFVAIPASDGTVYRVRKREDLTL